MDKDIQQQFNRLNAKLNLLIEVQKKEHWVKVGFVTRITGWDRETLRQAREQGLIEWRLDAELGRVYLLESIPSMFIRYENKPTNGDAQLDAAGAIAETTLKS